MTSPEGAPWAADFKMVWVDAPTAAALVGMEGVLLRVVEIETMEVVADVMGDTTGVNVGVKPIP